MDECREVDVRPLTSLDAATKVAGDSLGVSTESTISLATRASPTRLTHIAGFLETEISESFPGVVQQVFSLVKINF